MNPDRMNAREVLAEDHKEEWECLRYSIANRLRLNPDDRNTQYVLDEAYEMGYDQGSTMEAEYSYDS